MLLLLCRGIILNKPQVLVNVVLPVEQSEKKNLGKKHVKSIIILNEVEESIQLNWSILRIKKKKKKKKKDRSWDFNNGSNLK